MGVVDGTNAQQRENEYQGRKKEKARRFGGTGTVKENCNVKGTRSNLL